MAELNPAASHGLPSFITAPGETDVLMVAMSIILVLAVLGFGVLYFRLHSLPEQIAHKSKKVQLEIVAVLCLIALFTHMHIFWIAALLLAFIELPDFGTPLRRIAGSVERMAGINPGEGAAETPAETAVPPETKSETKQGDGAAALPRKPEAPASKKELSHA